MDSFTQDSGSWTTVRFCRAKDRRRAAIEDVSAGKEARKRGNIVGINEFAFMRGVVASLATCSCPARS